MGQYTNKLTESAIEMLNKLNLSDLEREITLIAAMSAIDATHIAIREMLVSEDIDSSKCVSSALAVALHVMHTLEQEKAKNGF